MLHGLVVGSLAAWYFTAGAVLSKRRQVVLYDLRGHGKSERAPTGYSLDNQLADLAGVLAEHGSQEPVSLVGHSFGGMVALRYALTHPDRIDQLVLVDVPLVPSKIGRSLVAEGSDIDTLRKKLPVLVGDRELGNNRRFRKLLQNVEFLVDQSSLADDLQAEPDFTDEQLASLRCPTMAIYGNDSFYRPDGERLRQTVPGLRFESLPGTHQVHLERAAQVTALLEDFLDG